MCGYLLLIGGPVSQNPHLLISSSTRSEDLPILRRGRPTQLCFSPRLCSTRTDGTEPEYCSIAKVPEYCSIAKVPEYCSISKVPEYCSIAKVPEYYSIAKVPEYCSIAKVPEYGSISTSMWPLT